MEVNTEYTSVYLKNTPGGKKLNPQEEFQIAKAAMEEEHKLTPKNIKNEDDWRKMSDKEWDKLVAYIDEYLDNVREELQDLKEKQEEAAQKMAAEAPARMRAIFAARASLNVAANGFMGNVNGGDADELEKKSWTYEMETDNQVILEEAQMANERVHDLQMKLRETALTGDIVDGREGAISIKEYDDEKEKDEKKLQTFPVFAD